MRSGVDCKGRNWEENLSKMKPDNDLTGKIFGRLTVLFRVQNDKSGNLYWLAKCECGNEVVAQGASLRNGRIKSCGCYQKDLMHYEYAMTIMPGEQFGYWTVIGKSDTRIGNGSYWRCRCICGIEKDVKGTHLRNGESSSCGCMHRQTISKISLIDLVGMRFGLLTVIKRSNKKNGSDVYWTCKCECGNIDDFSGHNLRRGSTLSCGCLSMSNGEYNISNILNVNNIRYTYNKAYFNDLKNSSGNLLRYDFILFNNDNSVCRIIEFDGKQHNEPVELFGGVDSFQKIQDNDAIKNQYALSHNIPLVRIPYSKRDSMTLDDLLGDKYLIKGEMNYGY